MSDACPRALNVDTGLLAATLEALNDCTQACVVDSDCDLGEQNVIEMVACIRLCLDYPDRRAGRGGADCQPGHLGLLGLVVRGHR